MVLENAYVAAAAPITCANQPGVLVRLSLQNHSLWAGVLDCTAYKSLGPGALGAAAQSTPGPVLSLCRCLQRSDLRRWPWVDAQMNSMARIYEWGLTVKGFSGILGIVADGALSSPPFEGGRLPHAPSATHPMANDPDLGVIQVCWECYRAVHPRWNRARALWECPHCLTLFR